MAISVTELRKGTIFSEKGTPLLVLEYSHIKMGRGTANIKVKVRNLKTGATLVKTFISGASVDEVEVERKTAQYLYSDGALCHFMDPKTFEQFSLPRQGFMAQAVPFLKEGEKVVLIYFQGEPLSVELPLKVNLRVVEAGPSAKGDTKVSATKEVVLETGYKLQVPMFIAEGDIIAVNTESGSYIGRV